MKWKIALHKDKHSLDKQSRGQWISGCVQYQK